MSLSVKQRRALELLASENGPTRVRDELCPLAAMQSMVRRGLVRAGARGYTITKQGREEITT